MSKPKPEEKTEIDLSKRISRVKRRLVESAMVPNSIEISAIKAEGLGVYNSKEFAFVRRFPQPRSDIVKTSVKAIADFNTIAAVNPNYEPLFFAMRTPEVTFDATVLGNIDKAQQGKKHFVLHEPTINQSCADFKKQYSTATKTHSNVIAVLDPAMMSLAELRRKAEFIAEQKPEYLIIHHRNPINYAIGYIQIVKPFVELDTRIIEVGVWPRYVYRGAHTLYTNLPLTCMLFGVDAVCQGVSSGGGDVPKALFLDITKWKYDIHTTAKKEVTVGEYNRKVVFAKGAPSYDASRIDAVFVADSRLRDVRSMNETELKACIDQSAYLKELFDRFAALWQEG